MQLTENNYPVSEIFESIQGEGNFAGVNSLFIRLHFCNLTCSWCDTKYTWTRFSGNFKVYDIVELYEMVKKTSKDHVIFTGGEPSLFRLDLLTTGIYKNFHVESNGTIIPVKELKIELRDGVKIERGPMNLDVINKFNWVISPKLSNSKQVIYPEGINFWAKQQFAVFKFIVGSLSDIEETDNFVTEYRINRTRVYLGLLGYDAESQFRPDLVDEIIKRGFHFSPRLHILLWGQKRGK